MEFAAAAVISLIVFIVLSVIFDLRLHDHCEVLTIARRGDTFLRRGNYLQAYYEYLRGSLICNHGCILIFNATMAYLKTEDRDRAVIMDVLSKSQGFDSLEKRYILMQIADAHLRDDIDEVVQIIEDNFEHLTENIDTIVDLMG
jgi:hypothetical protein